METTDKYYEIAKKNYDDGVWSKTLLRNLVRRGKLSAASYKLITGEDY